MCVLVLENYYFQNPFKRNVSTTNSQFSLLFAENPDGTEEQAKSHVEVLAEMRDYKRRRQSYRAKNVHITKRSATDVN